MHVEAEQSLRKQTETGEGDDDGEGCDEPPQKRGGAVGAIVELVGGAPGEPGGTMERQGGQRRDADQDRVPIENSGLPNGLKIGPEGFEEISGGVERNAAGYVA